MKYPPLSSALLVNGTSTELKAFIQEYLSFILCKNKKKTHGSKKNDYQCKCLDCDMIRRHQHPNIIHLTTQQTYTTNTINVIFEKAHFLLEDNQHFFFIINNAHLLNTTSANRLLKIVEEPPSGYHFIFATSNMHDMLATIISRCIIYYLTYKHFPDTSHSLITFFLPEGERDKHTFEKLLKKEKINHIQAHELISNAAAHYQYRSYNQVNLAQVSKIKKYLTTMIGKPPGPGSSTIFLKNVFLGLIELERNYDSKKKW